MPEFGALPGAGIVLARLSAYACRVKLAQASILILPGRGNSNPDHWQSRWEAKLSSAQRVQQDEWERPVRNHWVARIGVAVRASSKPVVLVTHSLGGIAAVWAAREAVPGKIAGAFIVAPPSDARIREADEIDNDFGPAPRERLPFPAVVVASRNDPRAPYAWSEAAAASWHAEFVDAGEAGHISGDDGFGPWPEGLLRFGQFMRGLGA